MPVEKSVSDHSTGSDSDAHKVFLGTSIVSGSATARVTETGKNTVFGEIATRLAKRAPETEFERGTRRFGLLIMKTTILLDRKITRLNSSHTVLYRMSSS